MNIMSKFLRNAVLVGCIDSYCLVCEAYLKNEDDVLTHIDKLVHKKKLNSTQYTEKYKEDRIWKVKNGYFCQFCNLLMSTATKVGLHVMEIKHKDNRAGTQLQRVGDTVIAFEDICICEKAWNGFIDDTCVLCGTEFTNELIHKSEPQHILNLVQSKPEFGAHKTIYRKIDEDSFQCLTCNMVFPMTSNMSHCDCLDHKRQYEKCRIASGGTIETVDLRKQDEDKDISSETLNVETIKEKIENKSTVSKGNTPLKKLNKEPVKKQPPRKKNKKANEEPICQMLGAKDYIMPELNGNAWCILCDWTMESDATYMHVKSKHHQTILQMHSDRLAKKDADVNQLVADVGEFVDVEANDVQSDDKSKLLDSVSRFQENEITVDFVSETVICKKCAKNINFDYDSIEKHIEEHKLKDKKESKTLPSGSNTDKKVPVAKPAKAKRTEEGPHVSRRSSLALIPDEDLENFAKQNNLTLRGNKTFCKICETEVAQSMKQMKDHVSSGTHKNKLSKKSEGTIEVLTNSKQPTDDFIVNFAVVSDLYIKEVIINEKYCINIFSFICITKTDLKLRCELCQLPLNVDQVEMHKNSTTHINMMKETPIITSMETEFLRELKPGVFHCGFCNLVKNGWENMEDHLNTAEHEESKISASWRLKQHVTAIRLRNHQENMEMALIMRMYLNGLNEPF